MELAITTFKGLENVLSEEIKILGGQDIMVGNRVVTTYGDKELLYKMAYKLRTGLKILQPINNFKVSNDDELYKTIFRMDFSPYLSPSGNFSIDIVSNSEILTHSRYTLYRIKDAIVDRMKKTHGHRPDINTNNPDFILHVRINKDHVFLSSDATGDSLHKRNYRLAQVEAPLNECMAAGLIMLSKWDKSQNFLDPMAGSGTIGIEAAMIASNTPPQIFRNKFTFKKWKTYNPALWAKICNEAKAEIQPMDCKIEMSDKDPFAIRIMRENIEKFNFETSLTISQTDFFNRQGNGELLIFNPPYDMRLRMNDINHFYSQIGDHLKKAFVGSEAWIFSSHLQALKSIGLRTSAKIPMFNGPLESKFCKYELFAGKKEY